MLINYLVKIKLQLYISFRFIIKNVDYVWLWEWSFDVKLDDLIFLSLNC